MADHIKIAWVQDVAIAIGGVASSLNPIRAKNKTTGAIGWHCEHASPGCQNCYAEAMNRDRFGTKLPYTRQSRDNVELFLDDAILFKILKWQKPHAVFWGDTTDIFGPWVPEAWQHRILRTAAQRDDCISMFLTKHPAQMQKIIQANPEIAALRHIWLGVSAEDQRRADQRIPVLMDTPAVVHFVSYEPALGGIDFAPWPGLDWIIQGDESGRNHRAGDTDRRRRTRAHCDDTKTAFYDKQIVDSRGRKIERPLLDGRQHIELPEVLTAITQHAQAVNTSPECVQKTGDGEHIALVLEGEGNG